MFDNFSQDYKQVMLTAEAHMKQEGYAQLGTPDVFLETFQVKDLSLQDLYTTYWLNENIVKEVFATKPFNFFKSERKGEYIGISKELKNIIISSVKSALTQKKEKADIRDFLFALVKSRTKWVVQFLEYVGIPPQSFQKSIEKLAYTQDVWGSDPIFEPLDNILSSIEQELHQADGATEEDGNESQNPFSQNPNQKNKKENSDTPALDFFGHDLIKESQEGKIDVIIWRDQEIERLISILNRKTKNNPCLVGEPGVWKTAVVEGIARRIASNNVPLAMQTKRIIALDLSMLVAGTKYRWEFESRIKQIIDEASKLENEIILFIDEIHTIIGAGSGEGTLDAANILKPAMGRGKICVIGATTHNEYQKYIEKDSALERRFQKIEIDEPDEPVAINIIQGLRESFEEYHNLIITNEAISAAVRFSTRYITDKFLPDKAIDLIDEACSAKSMKYNWAEEEIHEIKVQIEELQKKIESFIISQQYHKATATKHKQEMLEQEIREKRKKRSIPRENRQSVTAHDIEVIVAQITWVPVKELEQEDVIRLKKLSSHLQETILGQEEAIQAIVNSIKRSRVWITHEERPLGSFLFLWPTGVWKTELVHVLAQKFYGDPKALVKIDMSEFSERSSASKLIGTTAGYIGYEEGGMLTEKVRKKPYCIVLFDEIEKGTFEIYNLLLQILEDGTLTDGKGRKVNFKNTIIIMTSNIGWEEFTNKAAQIGFHVNESEEKKALQDYKKTKSKILGDLEDYFPPEFINRIDKVVVFEPLDKKIYKQIIRIQLEDLQNRLRNNNQIMLRYDQKSINLIAKKTYNPTYGARPIRRFLQEKLEGPIADLILEKRSISEIKVSVKKEELIFETLEK